MCSGGDYTDACEKITPLSKGRSTVFDRRSRDDGEDGEEPFRLVYVGRSSARIAEEFGARLEELSREGFDVHVLAGPDGGGRELTERGIEFQQIPVLYRRNLAGLVGAFFIVQAYLIEQPAVLVHGHDGILAWIAAVAANRARVPAIFASVGDHDFRTELASERPRSLRTSFPELVELLGERVGGALGRLVAPAAERGRRWMYGHIGGLVDRYVVTNERDFDVLDELDLVSPSKLEMVIGGRGIDVDRFDPDSDALTGREELREELEIPSGWRLVVGCRGDIVSERGGLDAFRILNRIANRRRDIGWLFSREAECVEEVALGERLRRGRAVLGPSSDDPAFYRAIDLLVHPATKRGLVDVLMKAQAMRVPVLAYDSAPNASVVANRQTGRLVLPGDLDALAELLEALLDNPKRLRDYGRRARARSTQRFDREDVDRQMLRLYDTVLEEKLPS